MAKRKKTKTRTKRTVATGGTPNRQRTSDKIEAKKAVVLGTGSKSRLPVFIAVACVAIIVGGGFLYYVYNTSYSSPVAATSSPAAQTATQVTFPASLFDDGKARHFQHVAGKFTIKYFILKSSDGIIRAAFDACDVCWPAGKGYYQDGDVMVCRNCGRRFASVLVNEVKGGCNPAPLNRNVVNGKVVIQVKDILEGKQYFNFS
jgi:uncharacterized membrane protein